MKKRLVLQHQSNLAYSREFFLMAVPKETTILFRVIVLMFIAACSIILFGRIDDVIKVNGIVRTQENVSSVNNVISGKIMEINYKPGVKVYKGDILYKINPVAYNAQRENLLSEYEHLCLRLDGTRQLIQSFDSGRNLVEINNTVAFTRFETFLKTREELRIQVKMSRSNYIEECNKPESLKNPRATEQRKMEHEYAASRLKSYEAAFIEKLYAEQNELSLAFNKNNQEILKLDSQYEFLGVRAPVDGYVQEISALNVGDYVEAGEKVINIVPNDLQNFRVEMQVPPKDMGKISVGMKVKYRLSAFPFFEYQGAEGEVTSIDPDVRTDARNNLFYCVYADIDRVQFENRRGDSFPIRSGLETNSRIVLENNSILFFILRKMNLFT